MSLHSLCKKIGSLCTIETILILMATSFCTGQYLLIGVFVLLLILRAIAGDFGLYSLIICATTLSVSIVLNIFSSGRSTEVSMPDEKEKTRPKQKKGNNIGSDSNEENVTKIVKVKKGKKSRNMFKGAKPLERNLADISAEYKLLEEQEKEEKLALAAITKSDDSSKKTALNFYMEGDEANKLIKNKKRVKKNKRNKKKNKAKQSGTSSPSNTDVESLREDRIIGSISRKEQDEKNFELGSEVKVQDSLTLVDVNENVAKIVNDIVEENPAKHEGEKLKQEENELPKSLQDSNSDINTEIPTGCDALRGEEIQDQSDVNNNVIKIDEDIEKKNENDCIGVLENNSNIVPVLEDVDHAKNQTENSLGQTKRLKKKEKRRKRSRNMEEDKENLPLVPRPTRIFTTLKEFKDLDLSKGEIYRCLERYVLDSDQLAMNRFPMPGIIEGAKVSLDGTIIRKCYRCLKRFEVTPNGKYVRNEECYYHPCKPKVRPGNDCLFACCSKPIGYPGCKVYPLHICGDPLLNGVEFRSIRDKRQVRVAQLRGVYALDCEMVYTGIGLEVAKVGLVNEEGLTIYETYVQPQNEVLDYCTKYSGITPKHLLGVTTTLSDVQIFLDQLLHSECILVGHGLDGDLRCLRLSHNKIVDTSVVFPRSNGSKQKLRDVALYQLNRIVQFGKDGHDCIEDARTCMALMLNKIKEDRAVQADSCEQKNIVVCERRRFNIPSSHPNMALLEARGICEEEWHCKNERFSEFVHSPEYYTVPQFGKWFKVCYICTHLQIQLEVQSAKLGEHYIPIHRKRQITECTFYSDWDQGRLKCFT